MSRRIIRTIIFCTTLFSASLCQAVVINEIRVDQSGADSDEYFELYGAAGESLDGLSYLVIGDQSSNQGYIEAVIDLSGYHIAADGFFLAAESGFSLHPDIDLITSLNFENGDNVTHLLVSGFSGSLHDDIDSDDNGVIDSLLWSSIIDSVALLDSTSGGDLIYSGTTVGPRDGHAPGHVYREKDGIGDWQAGVMTAGLSDSLRQPTTKAVAVTTVPEPGSLVLMLTGLLLIYAVVAFSQTRMRLLAGMA
jgi:hypothetical protein